MTGPVRIRPAGLSEAAALHALSVRSKAHWGYPPAFMALAAPRLMLPEEWFIAKRVLVADISGSPAGVAAVLPPDPDGVAELEHLFVDPSAMGQGIGAALLRACVSLAVRDGAICLRVLSDPQARSFYEHLGFRWIADAPSDAIPGRMLPRLERPIRETTLNCRSGRCAKS